MLDEAGVAGAQAGQRLFRSQRRGGFVASSEKDSGADKQRNEGFHVRLHVDSIIGQLGRVSRSFYNETVLRRELVGLGLAAVALGRRQEQQEAFVERVAGGFKFTEGPVWLTEGALVFSDIPTARLLKWSPKDGVVLVRENSGGANGNAVDSRGRLYTCEGATRRVTRSGTDNKIEILAESFEGKRLNSPNDIVVRRDSHAWFTDPAFGNREETRELPFHGVFHLKPNKELAVVARMDKRPNGLALSPDGRILFVAVSDERAVRAWDVDRNGEASNPRMVITGIDGAPDGMKLDAKGNIYVAANALAIYSPQGRLLRTLQLPEKPSNLCFGPDEKTIYVTARTTVYRVLPDAKPAQAQQ